MWKIQTNKGRAINNYFLFCCSLSQSLPPTMRFFFQWRIFFLFLKNFLFFFQQINEQPSQGINTNYQPWLKKMYVSESFYECQLEILWEIDYWGVKLNGMLTLVGIRWNAGEGASNDFFHCGIESWWGHPFTEEDIMGLIECFCRSLFWLVFARRGYYAIVCYPRPISEFNSKIT